MVVRDPCFTLVRTGTANVYTALSQLPKKANSSRTYDDMMQVESSKFCDLARARATNTNEKPNCLSFK